MSLDLKKQLISDKKFIADLIQGFVGEDKTLMFCYFSGSLAYGTFAENSDIDVTAFIDGLDFYIHTNMGDYDVFLLPKSWVTKRQRVDDDVKEYVKLFIDDIFSIDKNLIYENPKYHEDLEKLRNYDITKSVKKYLDNFYEYYMYYFVDNETPVKKFYHVIRVKGQLEHYLKTGVFNLEMDEKYRKEMLEFKQNTENQIGLQIYASKIGDYLEEIRKIKEGL